MPSLVRFHALAIKESQKAMRRYRKIDAHLAHRFQLALDEAIIKIADSPESWPQSRRRTHWVKTKRFPFVIY